MYKKGGWYYLMIAEGGTEEYHAVTIARSKSPMGPYEGYKGNPILTHRHLGLDYPISNVGHGDLVQLQDGSWYMVALGSRLVDGHRNLGRETFIAPVDWSGDWPVVSPGTGKIEWEYPAPALPNHPFVQPDQDDFRALCWNTLGTPAEDTFTAARNELSLRSHTDWFLPDDLPRSAAPNGCPGFYGRRQQHMHFSAEVTLGASSGMAGLMLLQNGFNSLSIAKVDTADGPVLRAIRNEKCGAPDYDTPTPVQHPREVTILWEAPCTDGELRIGIAAKGQRHTFSVAGQVVAESDGSFLGSECAGGFVGAYIGCFVSGKDGEATFRHFRYTGA